MRMPPFPGGHPPKPGFCHGGELFCATSASDNPVETINKLTAVIGGQRQALRGARRGGGRA